MIWRGVIILFLLGLLLSCARVVMPSGGPVDKTPPETNQMTPENYSTNFYADKIVIDFEEYIVLKNYNTEFISSPLFKEQPDKILRGKSLILKFDKDSLKSNTTYTLDFGNSIVDYRAGNVLHNFQYVFSTGRVIDSLFISGHLYWAEDLTPQEDVWVLLYKDYNDSTLSTQMPNFIAKTDAEGFFSINNIAPGTYGMAALKDINSNYIFDLPNEQIAFLDSTFVLTITKGNTKQDAVNTDTTSVDNTQTINIDSTNIKTEGLAVSKITQDSTTEHKHLQVYPKAIDLFLFEENFSNQYLADSKRETRYLLSLVFNEPYDTTINIKIAGAEPEQWVLESNSSRDTFNIWLIDTDLASQDSLQMYVDYYRTDSLQHLALGKDTLVFNMKTERNSYSKKNTKQSKTVDSLIQKKEYLTLTTNFKIQSSFDIYKIPVIQSSFPLDSIDISKIQFLEKVDTSFVLTETKIERDSINHRQFDIKYNLKEDTEYKIYIAPNAFIDYRNFGNDTLEQQFRTTKLEKYSEIQLELKGINQQTIIQLLNDNFKLINEYTVDTDTNLIFSYLNPGNYKLKIIEDLNHNNKWDTGNYLKKIQPETIRFYPENIPTKANWAHEIVWNLKEQD